MKRIFLLIAAALCGVPLAAQTTLEAYRRAVADYSWRLKAAAASTDEAVELREKARTGFLPRLSVAGSFSETLRHRAGVRRWNFILEPQAVQTLYGGGAVRAAFRQAALGCDIALCDEEFAMLDVRYAADYAYWNLSAVERYAGAMRRYVELIRSVKRVVDDRFSEGYIAKGDVLMIEARLSEAEYQLVAVEENLQVALHNFNILRGAAVEEPVELAETIADTIPIPPRIGLEEVLIRRPDYRAASLRAEQARIGVDAARAPYNPQVSIGAGGSWLSHTPNLTGATSADGTLFVQVSVPVFHWGERRRATGAARAALQRSQWAEAALHDDILREEINGWTAVVESRIQLEATAQTLRIAGENLSLSTYSYGEGLTTILDVLQAQLSWIQLYSNAIAAQYNHAVAVSAYRRITADL